MLAERIQLPSPEGLHLLQPSAELVERLLAELIDPHARVFLDAFFTDQPAAPQHPQMPAQAPAA